MSTTQGLVREHQLILEYVGLMERYARLNLQHRDLTILIDQAQNFINFIEEFADTFHHAKEENILFHYLDMPGVLTHCNPVRQMLNEHNQAGGYVHNMKDALNGRHLDELADNFLHYAHLLREHIFKEDHILYPMAEKSLSDAFKAEISAAFLETETRLGSAAIWEKYQALRFDLEKTLATHV